MAKLLETVERWLRHPRLPLFLALIGMILLLPVIGTGWQLDDYIHAGLLMDLIPKPPGDHTLFGLFAFSTGDTAGIREMRDIGVAPWYACETIRLAFFRPLTEILHAVDYLLWPASPLLMHLHSILWYGAVCWVATILCRRIMGFGWAGGLAAFVYATDKDHGVPVAWIANRNSVICTFLGILVLVLHDRWRRDGWRRGAFWAPACYAIGLLSGETTLAAGAFLFAYTVFIDTAAWHVRLRAFLPYVLITGVWLVHYKIMGYGPSGMGAYLNPAEEPLLFLQRFAERGPIFLFGRFYQVTVSLYENGLIAMGLHGNLWLWAGAVIALAFLAFILFPLFRRDPTVRFWATGMILGMVPVCTIFTTDRLFIFPGLGAAGILGAFLGSWLERKESLPTFRLWRIPAVVVGCLFALLHLVVVPLTLPLGGMAVVWMHRDNVARPAFSVPYEKDSPVKTVVLVNPPVAFWSMYFGMVRYAADLPVPPAMHTLGSGMFPLEITRVDDRTLEMACAGGFIQSPYDQMFRGPSRPMHVGDRIAVKGMTAEVLEVDGWQPSRARFTFPVPLEDASLLFLQWKDGRFAPYQPPAIGAVQSLHVPWTDRLIDFLLETAGLSKHANHR